MYNPIYDELDDDFGPPDSPPGDSESDHVWADLARSEYEGPIPDTDEEEESDTPFWVVGVTETCTRLAIASSHDQASEYIATLPDYEDGRYYIDGPVYGVVELTIRKDQS
jgi:hypothetical protein